MVITTLSRSTINLFIPNEKLFFEVLMTLMSAHLNIEIEPIHISDDERLKDNIVLLINKNDEDEVYQLEFNNDVDDELDLLLLKLMYLYEEIFKQESKLND